ncbi:hypothetical protein ACFYU9_13995 [Streptomyces sp. NPDC004327]|uniref:hypothetical protein n=1 Tax=unclassified Streptomyces TaxID=2593676 RepID=UPI00369A0D71
MGKIVAWVLGAVAIGLVGIAVLVDLDTGDKVASVVGAAVSLGLSAFSFVRSSGDGRTGARIRAGRRSTVIDGDVTGSAIGHGSKVSGPRRATGPGTRRGRRRDVDVKGGRDSKVILGDVRDSAVGDESERS